MIFVCGYWKILDVIRRQAKVAADRRKISVKAKEPVAGTSGGLAEIKMTKLTNGKDQKMANKEATTTVERGRNQLEGQQRPTGLSRAKINVTKTMIYIVVGFALCWMPRATYLLYRKFTVNIDCACVCCNLKYQKLIAVAKKPCTCYIILKSGLVLH